MYGNIWNQGSLVNKPSICHRSYDVEFHIMYIYMERQFSLKPYLSFYSPSNGRCESVKKAIAMSASFIFVFFSSTIQREMQYFPHDAIKQGNRLYNKIRQKMEHWIVLHEWPKRQLRPKRKPSANINPEVWIEFHRRRTDSIHRINGYAMALSISSLCFRHLSWASTRNWYLECLHCTVLSGHRWIFILSVFIFYLFYSLVACIRTCV